MASYFLGNRLLGSSARLSMWDDTQPDSTNTALFCPICGEVWARVTVTHSREWHPVIRACERHGRPGDDAAGSFIAPWRRTFPELPPEVLEYEAKLRLRRN